MLVSNMATGGVTDCKLPLNNGKCQKITRWVDSDFDPQLP